MSRIDRFEHRFVEFVPKELQAGVLYVSLAYATVVHSCPCGCGERVVTPLSPADWQLLFDGETVSLHPSLGNWSLACRSHYWVRRDAVVWAPPWSKERIEKARARDALMRSSWWATDSAHPRPDVMPTSVLPTTRAPSIVERLRALIRRR